MEVWIENRIFNRKASCRATLVRKAKSRSIKLSPLQRNRLNCPACRRVRLPSKTLSSQRLPVQKAMARAPTKIRFLLEKKQRQPRRIWLNRAAMRPKRAARNR